MLVRRLSSLLTASALVVGSAAVGLAVAPSAEAEVKSDQVAYQVTFVARQCPTYADIMANRARNNIQESLRDLGKDTVYVGGQPIDPTIEAANDPNCTPLDDWQFTLGTGYTGKTQATDYLSTVTNPYAQTIRVAPSTPELDRLGQPTGRNLRAAVTVTLTDEQARRAQGSNSLWTQGGTKTDPLLNSVFGADYGFGALRCAVDNLNGDNVEWIGYSSGSRHVFCYYYAVTPPPDAGTIVVRKSLAPTTNGPGTFRFVGNISYTTTNDFYLTVPNDTTTASTTFIRAAGDAWDFEEQAESGFDFVSLTCAQTVGSGSTWTITGRKAVVRVGDGATVVCDYVNGDVAPATGFLRLSKVTTGSVGDFPFLVTRGDGTTAAYTATTTTEGDRVVVAETQAAPAGTWTVRETLPAPTGLGSWAIDAIECDGTPITPTVAPQPDGTTFVSASRDLTLDQTTDCVFANRFTPGGEIQIVKRTTGGTGTFAFIAFRGDQVDSDGEPTDFYTAYSAKVTATGTATTAAPIGTQPELVGLPVGQGDASTWFVGELSPPDTETASWRATSAVCTNIATGAAVPVSGSLTARVGRVELTAANPRIRCVVDNALTPVGLLSVTKTIGGTEAGNQGAVTLAISCVDGTKESFTVKAGATGTTTIPSPVVIRDDTTCTVTETATGENSSAERSSTTFAIDDEKAVEALKVSLAVASGDSARVAVVNEYGGLAPSGATPATPGYALVGLLLVCVGAVAYAATGSVE